MKNLYILHAEKDKEAQEDLAMHLVVLVRDTKEIQFVSTLEAADIVLPLLSNHLIDESEALATLMKAISRKIEGKVALCPILIGEMAVTPPAIAVLLTLPRKGGPVKNEQDWADIVRDLLPLIRSRK